MIRAIWHDDGEYRHYDQFFSTKELAEEYHKKYYISDYYEIVDVEFSDGE